jgi:hypothetical protein
MLYRTLVIFILLKLKFKKSCLNLNFIQCFVKFLSIFFVSLILNFKLNFNLFLLNCDFSDIILEIR